MYFVRMDHNPMDSNPIDTTSRWDPLIKTVRIMITLFLDPKMKSPLDISNTAVSI